MLCGESGVGVTNCRHRGCPRYAHATCAAAHRWTLGDSFPFAVRCPQHPPAESVWLRHLLSEKAPERTRWLMLANDLVRVLVLEPLADEVGSSNDMARKDCSL